MDNDELYRLLKEDIADIKADIKATKEQATLTNGRVQQLELWKAWTSGAIKALIGVSAIPSIVLIVAILMGLR